MAQFSVKTNNARPTINEEKKIACELSNIESELRRISNSLSFKLAAKANIRSRLGNAANRVSAHRTSMSSMHSALQNVVGSYDCTENTIIGNINLENEKIQNISEVGYENSGYGESAYDKFKNYLNEILKMTDSGEYRDYILRRIESVKDFIAEIYESNIDFSTIGLIFGLPDAIQGDTSAFDYFIDSIKDTIVDKTGFKEEVKTSGSLYESQISCANGSLGVSLGTYEAYASAQGGLITKDKEGNLVFNPNIDAKMGVSFTALEAAGAYSVGDDWFGAGMSGDITVGKVSGETSVSASLLDEDGFFNPHAKLDANAEAILIDAKAQAGVTVLGTTAEVEAGVNVGIGAHANVEMGDGIIACDFGASFGIGASISFTIDYGGTVDAVKEATKGMAESVWNKVKWW